MNLDKEFTRINGALTTCENGQQLSQDLAKIQQEYFFYWALADNMAELVGEMHSELANWDPKTGEEFEEKFNEVMKR